MHPFILLILLCHVYILTLKSIKVSLLGLIHDLEIFKVPALLGFLSALA